MDKAPNNKKNNIEQKEPVKETFPTKEEVLAYLNSFVSLEGARIGVEKYDEAGLYHIDFYIDGNESGEQACYEYIRKIAYEGTVGAQDTTISVTYFNNGQPYHGKTFAVYDEETREWKLE